VARADDDDIELLHRRFMPQKRAGVEVSWGTGCVGVKCWNCGPRGPHVSFNAPTTCSP
jgi:hypothetical protein